MVDAISRNYFHASSGYWKFEDENSVIVARGANGETIAYVIELEAIVERLAPHGLPPAESIIAYLCCFKDKSLLVGMIEARLAEPRTRRNWEFVQSQMTRCHQDSHLSPIVRLKEVAPDVRNRLDFKVELAEQLFKDSPDRIGVDVSRGIVETMRTGCYEEFVGCMVVPSFEWTRDHLRHFFSKFESIDLNEIALQVEVGVPLLPGPAKVEPVPDVDPKDFLKSLDHDAELAGMASLAQHLLAAVTLPKRLNDQSQIEFGGYSDIANRGTPDRLLMSELANDDLTLAVRVAMNEAMYLRREAPPKNHHRQRLLLLHNGIRTWGLPRVFALATGLAFLATNDSHDEWLVFRGEGAVCGPAKLLTTAGLIEHLKSFSFELHPGPSLPALVNHYSELDSPADPVLILEESEFNDPEFQHQLTETELPCCIIATINSDGCFHLFHWDKNGSKTIRRAKFDLEDILSERAKKQLINERHDLPAIFNLEHFPLRLSHALSSTFCLTPYGLLVVTHDRRLMLWETPKTRRPLNGGIQLMDRVPHGTLEFLVDSFTNSTILVCRKNSKISVVLFENPFIKPMLVELGNVLGVRGFLFIRGVFAVRTSSFFVVFDLKSGESLQTLRFKAEKIRTRFLYTGNEWRAISVSGHGLSLEPMPIPPEMKPEEIIDFIESPDLDGQIAIRADGFAFHTAQEGYRLLANTNVTSVLLSKDRERAVIDFVYGTRVLVRANSFADKLTPIRGNANQQLELVNDHFVETPLRNRMRFVSISADHELVLTSRNYTQLVLKLIDDKLVLQPSSAGVQIAPSTRFEDIRIDQDFRLHQAVWNQSNLGRPDKVFLDSRGLVHLQSSNTDIPEVTLVLRDGRVSGWISTGETFGNSFYLHSDAVRISALDVYHKAIKPFVERVCDRLSH